MQAKSELHPKLQDLMEYIYFEATGQLQKSLNCSITEDGIETPLGVLSAEQVSIGSNVLENALNKFKAGASNSTLKELSNEYYTAVPHKFGRVRPPVLNDLTLFTKEFELLELMKDMVEVSDKSKEESGGGSVLASHDVDKQYESLSNKIEYVEPDSEEFEKVKDEIYQSQERSHGKQVVEVVNVYSVCRAEERKRFTKRVKNHRMLYHGSRIANWVGLLSRGILLPKVVVSLGVHRTDGGWLGSGIYFGEADTASYYAGKGHKGTSFMLMANVALGKMKDMKKITYGLKEPPKGFDSCHGVKGSEFADDEYCVYKDDRQYMAYLVELKRKGGGYVS
mmetsp:Transcript_13026/g.21686  ORF Transcript_13026/g.21686 Transcript_13026/m.21686 type:complete len:337 (+) Transcript_13026:550-1560(+)